MLRDTERRGLAAYLLPLLLMLTTSVLWMVEELTDWDPGWAGFPLALLYGAGAIGWTRTLLRRPGPRWLRMLASWLPAWPIVLFAFVLQENDNAWIGLAWGWPIFIVPLFAAAVATWLIAFYPPPRAREA